MGVVQVVRETKANMKYQDYHTFSCEKGLVKQQ